MTTDTAAQPKERDPGVTRFGTTPLGLLIFAYILVGVGRIHEHFRFLFPLRPALLTFLLIVGYTVINPKSLDPDKILESWHGKAVILIGVCAIGSAIFGLSLGAVGLFIIQHYATVLIFGLVMVAAVGVPSVLKAGMLAFVLSSAFWLYLAFFVLGASRGNAINGILRLDFHYTYDANDICVIFAVALPLTLLFHRTVTKRWQRIGLLICAVGVPAAVALSGSRGGLLGLVATGVALLFLVREVSLPKKIGLVFASVVAIVLMAPQGYWKQMETILNPKEDYNWSDPWGRRQIWLRGMGYVESYPVFGVGANQFPRAEATIGPLAVNHVAGTALRYIAPHNTTLQVAAEIGLPALAIWMSVILIGIFWLPRQRRNLSPDSDDPDEKFLYYACTFLPASWVGFLVASTFVSFAYLVPFYILNAYTAGIAFWLKRLSTEGIRELAPVPAAAVRPPEWRSRRPIGPQTLWEPGRPAARSALPPREGFAPEG